MAQKQLSYADWTTSLKEDVINVDDVVSNRANTQSIVMWCFSVRKSEKFQKLNPDGSQGLPNNVIALVKEFLGPVEIGDLPRLWDEATHGQTAKISFVWDIARRQRFQDRLDIRDYYRRLVLEACKKGNTKLTVTQEIMDAQPKLSNGEVLDFAHVAHDLRKMEFLVDNDDELTAEVNEEPPHLIGWGVQFGMDKNIERIFYNFVGQSGKAARLKEVTTNKRKKQVQEATQIIVERCTSAAEEGESEYDVSEEDIAALKAGRKFLKAKDLMSELVNVHGFRFFCRHHNDEDANGEDGFTLKWGEM